MHAICITSIHFSPEWRHASASSHQDHVLLRSPLWQQEVPTKGACQSNLISGLSIAEEVGAHSFFVRNLQSGDFIGVDRAPYTQR